MPTFKDVTFGPKQKTPWRGIGFLQPSGRFEWDTTLKEAAGQWSLLFQWVALSTKPKLQRESAHARQQGA